MSKKSAPVVIVRKDKRINHKILHGIAFAVTGGASGVVTAAEAANHAAYNARTRQLQAQAEAGGEQEVRQGDRLPRPPGGGYRLIPASEVLVTDHEGVPSVWQAGSHGG